MDTGEVVLDGNNLKKASGYMNQENDFCFLDDFPEFSQERELLA